MTKEELEEWHEWRLRNLNPVRPAHWTIAAARAARKTALAAGWKRLAAKQAARIRQLEEEPQTKAEEWRNWVAL